jgi:hypothetical protein
MQIFRRRLVRTGSGGVRVRRAIAIIALAAAPLFADEVYLRGGGQLTGEIVEQTEDSVTVDIGGGTLTAPMSSVVRIEEGVSPLQEYRTRAASIPAGDAEAWRKLARWAQARTLSSQAWEAYSEVVEILPDDEEANLALGRVLLDGEWVSEEESYRSQGYVRFEGEWMTPGEQQAIVEARRTREAADRQANEAQIQAIQAEIDADKEREAQEFERKTSHVDDWSQHSDPVAWGWGAGPSHWPSPTRQAEPQELAGSATPGR